MGLGGLFSRKPKQLKEIDDLMRQAERAMKKEGEIEHLALVYSQLLTKSVDLERTELKILNYSAKLREVRDDLTKVLEDMRKLRQAKVKNKQEFQSLKAMGYKYKADLERTMKNLKELMEEWGERKAIAEQKKKVDTLIVKLERKITSITSQIEAASKRELAEMQRMLDEASRDNT